MGESQNPFDVGADEREILRNTTAFTDRRYHGEREEQVNEMVNMLRPITEQQRAPPVLVSGPAGSGKTTTLTHVLSQLDEQLRDRGRSMIRISVRGLISDTQRARYGDALMQLDNDAIVKKNISAETVRQKFYDTLAETDECVVIHIVAPERGDAESFVRELKHHADTKGKPEGLIAETTEKKFSRTLGDGWEHVHFPQYTAKQLSKVLNGIAVRAFRENTVTNDAIDHCATEAINRGGSAAQAAAALRRAGQLAAHHGDGEVKKEHVQRALELADRDEVLEYLTSTTPQQNATVHAVVRAVEESESGATVTSVKESYEEIRSQYDAGEISKRTLRRRLQELEAADIVEAVERNEGANGGRRHLYRPTAETRVVRDALESARSD